MHRLFIYILYIFLIYLGRKSKIYEISKNLKNLWQIWNLKISTYFEKLWKSRIFSNKIWKSKKPKIGKHIFFFINKNIMCRDFEEIWFWPSCMSIFVLLCFHTPSPAPTLWIYNTPRPYSQVLDFGFSILDLDFRFSYIRSRQTFLHTS